VAAASAAAAVDLPADLEWGEAAGAAEVLAAGVVVAAAVVAVVEAEEEINRLTIKFRPLRLFNPRLHCVTPESSCVWILLIPEAAKYLMAADGLFDSAATAGF
jgi:hypothetical protein